MKCPHCETHIDEHEANRCLDAWVEEKVMGKGPRHYYCPHFDEKGRMSAFCACPVLPRRSTSIADAWMVVKQLITMRWMVFVAEKPKGDNYCRLEWEDPLDPQWASVFVRDPATPLAICKAALKAVGHD